MGWDPRVLRLSFLRCLFVCGPRGTRSPAFLLVFREKTILRVARGFSLSCFPPPTEVRFLNKQRNDFLTRKYEFSIILGSQLEPRALLGGLRGSYRANSSIFLLCFTIFLVFLSQVFKCQGGGCSFMSEPSISDFGN